MAGTVAEALGSAVDALRAAGVESPRLDAELMLAEATGYDRAQMIASPERGVEAAAARVFGGMMRRRIAREPIAYVLGRKGFRRIELRSDRRALVPRPETEMLVDLAIELQPAVVADIGTGSGAIALAIADELPGCDVHATDISPDALSLAAANAMSLDLIGRVRLRQGTLPDASSVDLLLANLPYIPEGDWNRLEPEITEYEPRVALVSGADGLDAIRELILSLSPPGEGGRIEAGTVGLEIGDGQGGVVSALLEHAGYRRTEIRRDLAGLERVVVGR